MSKFLDKTGLNTFWAKIKSTFQTLGNLVTTWSSTPSDTKYPSEKLVKTSLDGKANDSDVVHKTGTETVSGAKTFSNNNSVFAGKAANDINGIPLSLANGSFRTELGSPTLEERGVIEETFANQLELLPKENISYETSPRGTETWTTLTVSDDTHNLLWGGNVTAWMYISKTVDFRITITSPSYCYLSYLYFYATGNGATFNIKLERKYNGSGAWSVVSDTAESDIGWPGHNTIRHSYFPFSATDRSKYGMVRLTLYMVNAGNVESYPSYVIHKFHYYGAYPYKGDPWIEKNGRTRKTNFPYGITSGVAIPISSGGTGATTAIGAEYNILNQVADIDTTINGDRKIALCNQTKSASDGVFRWLKLSNIWTWIKGLLSSESGVNISGNAATATTAAGYTSGGAIDTALQGKVDKVTGKGLSTNDYTTTEKNKLAGIAAGAEVNVQADWNQTTTTADDYIKNKPTIPSGTQLVYDCGTGSTSTTDFENALAALNAGKWVILRFSGNVYHCVGTYHSGLRFKYIANESSMLKVYTVNWTSGSAPTSGTSFEAALKGDVKTYGAGPGLSLSNTTFELKTGYNTSGKNYGVQVDSDGNPYVNVPWTDNNTDTKVEQTLAGNSDSNTYPLLLASDNNQDSTKTGGAHFYHDLKFQPLSRTLTASNATFTGGKLDGTMTSDSLHQLEIGNGSISASDAGSSYIPISTGSGSNHRFKKVTVENALWLWIKSKIASVLKLTENNGSVTLTGTLAGNATSATSAERATYATTAGHATTAGEATTADSSTYAQCLWDGDYNAPPYIIAGLSTSSSEAHPITEGMVELASSGTQKSKLTSGSLSFTTQGGGASFSPSGVTLPSTATFQVLSGNTGFDASSTNIRLRDASSQSVIQAKIENSSPSIAVTKSSNSATLSPTRLDVAEVDVGVGSRVRMFKESTSTDGIVCTNGTAGIPLYASKFVGNLEGNADTATTATTAQSVPNGSITPAKLNVGVVRKNGDFFIPRLPTVWTSSNINIANGSNSVAADVIANGYGSPLIVYNGSSAAITVTRTTGGSTATIPAYKHKVFIVTSNADGFYDQAT